MKKFLLSILCLFSIVAVYAETYSFTFEGKQFSDNGTVSLNDVDWTLAGDGGYWGFDTQNGKGQQFGSGNKPYTAMTLSTNGIYGTITEIKINTSGANSIVGTLDVTVGGNAFGSQIALTKTATDYTLTGEAKGEIVFSYAQTSSKAIYIKSIEITYIAEASGATLSKPVASVEPGTIYNTTTVELSSESEGTIHYTIDGTEPTAESAVYSEAIAVSEFGTTTIKAIVINGEEKSDVATFSYSLRVADPVFSIEGGVYEKLSGANALTFSTETNGATILYNNRGGDPRTEGSKTWGSLSVLSTAVVQAVAFVTNAEGDSIFSNVVKEYYTISPVKPFKVATEIVSGTKYLINYEGVIGEPHYTTTNYGYLFTEDATVNGDFIETNEYYGFTITETETAGEYTIMDANNRYYYMKGTYNNFNATDDITEIGDAAIWTIAIEDDCTATITNKATGKNISYSTSYNNFEAIEGGANLPILYAMREYPTLTITPESWATVESITKVVVTCEDGIALNESDELYATYRDPDWNMGLDFGYGKVSDDGKSVIYELETPLTANGDYSITFPAGLFTLDPEGLAIASENESLGLTVDNPNILELTYANPNGESTVKSIEYLYFEFSQDIVDNVQNAVITDDKGNEYPLSVTYTDGWGSATPYNALCLKTAAPITEPGTYTFVLKKNYIASVNNANVTISEDITYTFTIVEGLKVTSVSPVEGATVSEISEIVIDFNNYVYHDYLSSIWVMDENGNEYQFVKSEELEYNTMSINFTCATPITAAGTYTFTLEEYAVYGYDSSWNMETIPTQSFTFVFNGSSIETGIDETVADGEGEKVIFDLTGRRVKEINKAGIYIINGVKTVVE